MPAAGLFATQLGWATNNVLFYIKGGAAVTDNRNPIYSTATGALLASTGDDTRWGGTVGVGLEYGLAPGWSAGVELSGNGRHLAVQRNQRFPASAESRRIRTLSMA